MLFKNFPDLMWLKQQAQSGFSDKKAYDGRTLKTSGWPTVILNVDSSNVHRDNIKGPLSIFSNFSGSSEVTVENRSVKVPAGFFFVTNQNQYYTLDVGKHAAETFNIHFGEQFAQQVLQSMGKTSNLLDNPFSNAAPDIGFHNKLHFANEQVSPLMKAIQNADEMEQDELLYQLTVVLLEDSIADRALEQELPAVKAVTRQEIVRRMLVAKDYIHSNFDQGLDLEEIASTACFSKFHFLRLFKLAFGKTPHHFLNEVRIERSKALLKQELHVSRVASAVGITDANSFSRLFKKHVGVYPTQFR